MRPEKAEDENEKRSLSSRNSWLDFHLGEPQGFLLRFASDAALRVPPFHFRLRKAHLLRHRKQLFVETINSSIYLLVIMWLLRKCFPAFSNQDWRSPPRSVTRLAGQLLRLGVHFSSGPGFTKGVFEVFILLSPFATLCRLLLLSGVCLQLADKTNNHDTWGWILNT